RPARGSCPSSEFSKPSPGPAHTRRRCRPAQHIDTDHERSTPHRCARENRRVPASGTSSSQRILDSRRLLSRRAVCALGLVVAEVVGSQTCEEGDVAQRFQLSKPVRERPRSEWATIAVELLGAKTEIIEGERWHHRVIHKGDGPPLLMYHGIGGHAETY